MHALKGMEHPLLHSGRGEALCGIASARALSVKVIAIRKDFMIKANVVFGDDCRRDLTKIAMLWMLLNNENGLKAKTTALLICACSRQMWTIDRGV
jgi:hypothetical protein